MALTIKFFNYMISNEHALVVHCLWVDCS